MLGAMLGRLAATVLLLSVAAADSLPRALQQTAATGTPVVTGGTPAVTGGTTAVTGGNTAVTGGTNVPGVPDFGFPDTAAAAFASSTAPAAATASTTEPAAEASVEGAEAAEPKSAEMEAEGMESEEKEQFSPEGVGVAYTLLGSLFFGMIILYLVNWWDDDVRRYSWMVISMTISIFCAVLMYGGTTHLLEKFVGINEETVLWQKMLFLYALFVAWFIILQLATAFASGMLCCGVDEEELDHEEWVVENGLRATHETALEPGRIRMKGWGLAIGMGDDGYPVFAKKRCMAKEKIDRRMKCWATLISHTAGFAAISAGTNLQHLVPFSNNWGLGLLATLIHWTVLVLIFQLTVLGTLCLVRLNKSEELINMYKEQIWDAEVDVCALAVSALITQSIKFALSGVLADEEGRQPFESIPSTWTGPALLFGIGCVGLVVGVVMTVAASRRSARGAEEQTPTLMSKLNEVVQTVFTMTFSWCTLYAARWTWVALYKLGKSPLKPGSMLIQVCLSVSISMIAFAFTVVLDKIEDMASSLESRRHTDMLFKGVISSIGLAVGLTWEKCFDRSLEVAASQSEHPEIAEFVLSVFVVALIVPAWRRYILAKQIYYDEMKVDMAEEHFVRKEQEEQDANRLVQASKEGGSCFFPGGR